MVNRGRLQKVDWTRAAQPNVFGFIRCAGGSAAWPPGPGAWPVDSQPLSSEPRHL